jgi:hypothetical protein
MAGVPAGKTAAGALQWRSLEKQTEAKAQHCQRENGEGQECRLHGRFLRSCAT